MDQAELNLLLDRGFELWQRIVGHDPERRRFNHEQWDLRDQANDLQEARRLDPTGITAFMLLKTFSLQYITEEKVSAMDLIVGLTEEQEDRIEALRGLYNFLQKPLVDAIVEGFIGSVRAATKHYGIDHKDLEAWLSDYHWMATLRRDALKSFEKLEAHQFFHGKPGASDRVFYNTKVMEFWNIPSLVRAMQAQGLHGVKGVTLCLVRDPEALHSFFVIAVVNGESLTILTDRQKFTHPLEKKMSRRPDKGFIRRAEQQWFPYELVKVAVSADERSLYAEARTAIVPINAKAVELSDFSSLHPADAIWLSLLFELVCWKYLEENLALPETSYTGEMVREPYLLIAARQQAIVPVSNAVAYKPLEARKLTRADVTAETTKEQWGRPPVGHNEWMIDRYGEKVPEEVLNVIGEQEREQVENAIGLAPTKDNFLARWERPRFVQAFDPLTFGTAVEVENDRVWAARYNQCKVIQKHALDEFEATKDAMRGWLEMHFQAQKEWLIEQGVRGELYTDILEQPNERENPFPWEPVPLEPRRVNMVSVRIGRHPYAKYEMGLPYKAYTLSRFRQNPWGYACAATDINATHYHVRVRPEDAKSLALLAGVDVSEMPWQLQRWTRSKEPQYTGNHILNRCDPSDWVLENPWCEETRFHICIIFSLSKRHVNTRRKELSLPPIDWEPKEK
jgi:hypothetical protein